MRSQRYRLAKEYHGSKKRISELKSTKRDLAALTIREIEEDCFGGYRE